MAKEKNCSTLGAGSKVDVVRSSGGFRSNIVSLSLRLMAWHGQCVPPSFVDLLHCEERLSLEEYGQYHTDVSTSALEQNVDQWNPCGFHTTVSIVFGLLIVWR
jgi:hypothetical protein